MDSSATLSHHPKLVPKQCHSLFPGAGKYPSSRRTASFSSSSSSSLSPYNSSSSLDSFYFAADNDPLLTPSSPHFRFSGVPFSWEHLPGIPKKQTPSPSSHNNHLHQESSIKLLPLPPPTNHNPAITTKHSCNNKKHKNSLQRDPFFAAMLECSKDIDDHLHDQEEEDEEEITSRSSHFWTGSGNNSKVSSRSLSDRFGFINLYSSCKRASAVSESIIYLPSSRRSHFGRRSL